MPTECSAQVLAQQTLQSGIYNPLWYTQPFAGRAGTGTQVSWTLSPSADHHPNSSSLLAFLPVKAV